MIFKKRKSNLNKTKGPGRKRRVFITLALLGSLLFGKPRLNFSRSSSSNFGNQAVHERVIDDREFNSFEENDRQAILAKADGSQVTPPTRGSGPSHFPTPPSGGRPSRPVAGVNPYRVAPKLGGQGQGLGAGANPAGAGGGGGAAEFDDQDKCSVPDQSQESKNLDYRSNYPKNKNKSEDQCQPRILKSRIKEDPGLVRAAKKACKDQLVQADINHLEEQLAQGNMNPGIGSTPLGNGFMEHRGANGGRIIVKEVKGGVVEIYGKSGKRPTNQNFVIKRVLEIFG